MAFRWLLRAWLACLLPAWAAGAASRGPAAGEPLMKTQNEGDWLADWQRNLWTSDKQAIIVGTTNYLHSDRAGVWVRDGDTPRFANNREYKKPIEFFFGGENHAPDENEAQLVDFRVEDLGHNHTLMSWTQHHLRGIYLRVRKLGDRWVGVFLHQGKPAVSYAVWAKTRRNWMGVDQGLDYISVHGYWVEECKITDKGFSIPVRDGDGEHFALKPGMPDPLAACPNPEDEEPEAELSSGGPQAPDSRAAAWPSAGALLLGVALPALVVVAVAGGRRHFGTGAGRGEEAHSGGVNGLELVS